MRPPSNDLTPLPPLANFDIGLSLRLLNGAPLEQARRFINLQP